METLWAWIQLRLSLSLMGYGAPQTAAMEGGSEASKQPPGALFGHIEGLIEAMQFWRLFQVLIDGGKARAAAKLLVLAYQRLAAHEAHRCSTSLLQI